MNKFLLIFFFLPVYVHGQKFELSTMGGHSQYEFSQSQFYNGGGLSGLVSLAYYPVRQISLGITGDINNYQEAPGCAGGFIDFHNNDFFAGIDVAALFLSPNRTYSTTGNDTSDYKSPSLSLGIHIGFQFPITKRLSLSAKISVGYSKLSAVVNEQSYYYTGFSTNSQQHILYASSVVYENVTSFGFFLGSSYRF